MGAEVYVNSREVSAKKDSNTSMAAMPDVCLSPPSPPAGPIPIPYPNFSMGSDTSSGTKKVKIKGQEAGIKNNSNYKKSKGNEAATRNFGMGVVSHALSGKMQHAAWSMDVKFEGKNAIRLLDLTTHNHGSGTNGGVTSNLGKFKVLQRQEANCEDMCFENEEAQEDKHPNRAANGERPVVPEGQTIASAQFNPASGPSYRINSGSHMSSMKNRNGWTDGNKNDDGSHKPTELCAKAKKEFEYSTDKTNQGPRNHAESRIIETLFKQFGKNPVGTLTFRVQQRKMGSNRCRSSPCDEHCRPLLCAAEKCGLKIYFCHGPNQEPTKLSCD